MSLRIWFYKVITASGNSYHLSSKEIDVLLLNGELQPWEASKRQAGQHYPYIWLDYKTIQEAKSFDLRGVSCKPRPEMLRISEAYQ